MRRRRRLAPRVGLALVALVGMAAAWLVAVLVAPPVLGLRADVVASDEDYGHRTGTLTISRRVPTTDLVIDDVVDRRGPETREAELEVVIGSGPGWVIFGGLEDQAGPAHTVMSLEAPSSRRVVSTVPWAGYPLIAPEWLRWVLLVTAAGSTVLLLSQPADPRASLVRTAR